MASCELATSQWPNAQTCNQKTMSTCKPTLETFPPPPPERTGWPWTEASPLLPETMPDGQPWPRISIVTPSYNQGQFIEETIRSVLLQGYPNLEYIIIDGGSSDESVEIIRKYEPWLTYWVSEKDRGQAHAINKGLERCTGDWFNWINSDDLLVQYALSFIGRVSVESNAIAGEVEIFNKTQTEYIYKITSLNARNLVLGLSGIYHQPGVWLRTRYVKDCGSVDNTFIYTFDVDLSIRYLTLYPEIVYIPKVLAKFRVHEESKTSRFSELFHYERIKVIRKLLSLERFGAIHEVCRERVRSFDWYEFLHELNDQEYPGRHWCAWKIAILASSYPSVRWSRFTLGAIRRAIFSTRSVRK
jgi:glycosyltransferase involved in cell wall biosynthesis